MDQCSAGFFMYDDLVEIADGMQHKGEVLYSFLRLHTLDDPAQALGNRIYQRPFLFQESSFVFFWLFFKVKNFD